MLLLHTITLVLVLVQLKSSLGTVSTEASCPGGIETYMQRLPGTVLANYICQQLSPRFKRETTQLSQVQAKFGATKIARLTYTLSTFFNEDIADYFDLLMNLNQFYWAERSVLKKALLKQKVSDYNAGIESIKHLRDITNLQLQLGNMSTENMCGLYTMLSAQGDSADCALLNLRNVAGGDPCEGYVYTGPR